MFLTVASYKGGVGKTTTAVQLAAYLQRLAPTLLIDGDPNHSATAWGKGGGLPFRIVDEKQGPFEARNYEHVVIDTEARPTGEDFEALARGCDMMVIPAVPAKLDTEALLLALAEAQRMGLSRDKYRVLLTKVPPPPETDAAELRAQLEEAKYPLFEAEIPRLKSFDYAAHAGVPVYDLKDGVRGKRAWAAYEAAGQEIDRLIGAAAPDTGKARLHG